jgi:hypothetical protein
MGHVSPTDAAAFLGLTAQTSVDDLAAERGPDPVTRAYFRDLEPETLPGRRPISTPGSSDLARLLEEAGVTRQGVPLLSPPKAGEPRESMMVASMLRLRESDDALHRTRTGEILYLANALISGATLDGRRFRPAEAAQAAVDLCDAGLAHLLARAGKTDDPVRAAASILTRTSAVKLFRIGYRLQRDDHT